MKTIYHDRTARQPFTPMIDQLGRRCALVMLASMTFAVTMGLMAWGPVELTADSHRYADEPVWLGLPGAANVWVNAAMFSAGVVPPNFDTAALISPGANRKKLFADRHLAL